jgi:Zn-dependent peptidase ImmA (M78 family)
MYELLSRIPGIVAESCVSLSTSGRTQWNGDHWLIQVGADEPHVRQRSSLAHELAHIVLHPVADLALPGHGHRTAETRLETACEYFAACLLMPRTWIKRAYFQSGIQDVPSLARLFGVSWTAMNIRLEQLVLVARPDARSAA